MNRLRSPGFLVGALLLVTLAVPGSALAAQTWDLASEFTATAPGANPDHDPYGATPWTYQEGSSTAPSTFTLLPTFTAGVAGGLSTWSDTSSGALVGLNPTASALTDGTATVPPGQIFVEPPAAAGAVVAVGWTSPLSKTATIAISGSLSADAGTTPACTYSTTWTVEQDGNSLASGALSSATPTGSFSTSAAVVPGDSIFVVVSNAGDPACDSTGLSFQIQTVDPPVTTGPPGTPLGGPSVTLTRPVPGSSSTVATPTFSGAAGNRLIDASPVTLRVYSGQAASGRPIQTVTVPRSGATWSATLTTPLAVGTYTAQAEQDDSAGDKGLSSPVTFTVRVPAVTLSSLGSRPLTTSTPTLTGTADFGAGSAPSAVVEIFSGSTTAGSPVRKFTAPVAPSGQFSIPVTPALPDGTYTAVAGQVGAVGLAGFSAPVTFSVDTHAPPVTLVSPAIGSRVDLLHLVFAGAAGAFRFDSPVTIALYKGKTAVGVPVGAVQGKATGSTWSATWPTSLPRGAYTVLASQADAFGHIGVSAPHTFVIMPVPSVVGSVAKIDRAGRVSVRVACNEPSGDTCSGTVIVLTRDKYQPLAGGPAGRLTVMFAFVSIPGGQTATISRTALRTVATVVRRRANVAVTISARLHPLKGQAIRASTRGELRSIGK